MNKKAMHAMMKLVPARFFHNFSYDEILSDVSIAYTRCSNNYNPKRGIFTPYLRRAIINQLNTSLRTRLDTIRHEVPINNKDFAYSTEYTDDQLRILAFLRTLPTEFVNLLTAFIQGQINKEDLINRSPFESILVERIIGKLDNHLVRCFQDSY